MGTRVTLQAVVALCCLASCATTNTRTSTSEPEGTTTPSGGGTEGSSATTTGHASSGTTTTSSGTTTTSSGTTTTSSGTTTPAPQPTTTATTGTTTVTAPSRPFPPPPQYSEVEARLRNDPRGGRCFTSTTRIVADLTASYGDGDLDGDGRPERVLQLPDCLVVSVQGETHWELPYVYPRSVNREVESVRLVVIPADRGAVLEVRDTRTEPVRSREVTRFRWTGSALVPAP